MKLSQRERTLLIILAFVLVAFGGYYGVISPQMKKIDTLKTEQEALKQKYDEFIISTDPNNPVFKQRTVMDTKVRQVSSLFFPELKQEKFILLLEEHMAYAGIKPEAISFTNVESGTSLNEGSEDMGGASENAQTKILKDLKGAYLGQKKETAPNAEAAQKEKEALEQLMGNVERQTVTLNYSGDIFSLMLFLDAIESYSRRIVVNQVSMISDALGRQQSTIEITYYAIPKLHEQDQDFMAWNLIGPYGKVDPFYGNFPVAPTKASPTKALSQTQKADFFMMLNPISSDLTTLIMSKMDDRSRQSYIYSDRSDVETVTLKLIEKEGKYYFSYQAGSEKFPTGIEPEVFVPNGNLIKIQVMSSPRSGSEDVSGVKLNVENQTQKPLVLEIYNDDQTSRLQLGKTTGQVKIVKK